MASKQDAYQCIECGWTSPKWVGRCGECQAWGSVAERGMGKTTDTKAVTPLIKAQPIGQVDAHNAFHRSTGVGELDRVLGGGLVPGAVVLLAGEPGVGKSTLLLEVAANWARTMPVEASASVEEPPQAASRNHSAGQRAEHSGATRARRALYVTGEESSAQVRQRAGRIGALADQLYLAAETDLGAVLGHIEEVDPSLLVLDSVQAITGTDGTPGGVTQVREVTAAIVRAAKQRDMAVIIIGHSTKDGSIAGPRTMEHLVDVVLSFEGDRRSELRLVRSAKNRFGPSDEVGCFVMGESGISEVADPAGLFTHQLAAPTPGTGIAVTMEGRRPMLAELQALVAPVPYETPARRVSNGVDSGRVAMILAVLQRKAKIALSHSDVYTSTVGGARISDPAADLAIAIAVASGVVDRHYPRPFAAIGEIGLAGELRRVPAIEKRLAEAARLGLELAVVPVGSLERNQHPVSGIRVVEAATLTEALSALDLRRKNRSEAPLDYEDVA
jgi:DNA repair protein RadA/Sms